MIFPNIFVRVAGLCAGSTVPLVRLDEDGFVSLARKG